MDNAVNKIFCYSGTGNCLASAKQMAAELGMEVVHITDELAQSGTIFKCHKAVIIFPVYAYGMPKTVKRFIKNNSFEIEYLAVLTTFGSRAGGAYVEAVRLFGKKKQRVSYMGGSQSVENYVHMFKLPDEDRIKILQEKQREITAKLADDIRNEIKNKKFRFRPDSVFISWLFRRFTKPFAKRYKFNETCNGCGICYRVCPAAAIKIENAKPVVNPKKCDHCQACLQLCPRKAISFGKIRPASRRYCHADIKVIDMIKRES